MPIAYNMYSKAAGNPRRTFGLCPEGWARAIPNITELTEQIRGHFKDAAIVHLQPREISSMADSMKLWATSDVIITPHGGNMAMIPGCNFELRSLIRSNFDSESNK